MIKFQVGSVTEYIDREFKLFKCIHSPSNMEATDLSSEVVFQPVLHDRCNKGCGMCHPVCKRSLATKWKV